MYALELYLSHGCVGACCDCRVRSSASQIQSNDGSEAFSLFVRLLPSVDLGPMGQPASLGIARLPANTWKVQRGAPPCWLSVSRVTNMFVHYNVATRFAWSVSSFALSVSFREGVRAGVETEL